MVTAQEPNSAWNSKALIITLVLLVTVAVVWLSVSISTLGSSSWYSQLKKPPGMIPNVGFSIVWGILYTLVTIGIVYAVSVASPNNRGAIALLYIVILLMTLLWVWVFNSLQMIGLGLLILFLTVLLVATLCYKTRSGHLRLKRGRWDWIPSVTFGALLLWLLVATYYNSGIVALN